MPDVLEVQIDKTQNLTLDQVIGKFVEGKRFNVRTTFNQCFLVSSEFLDLLDANSIEGNLIQLNDYRGPYFPNCHPEWRDLTSFLSHYVVMVENKSYDFTYRQFDPSAPVPFIQTVEQLRTLWDKLYTLTDEGSILHLIK